MDRQNKIPETGQFYVDPVQLSQYECNRNAIEMLENQADKYGMPILKQIHLYLVPVMNGKTGGDERQNWRCSSDSCSVATNARMKVLSIESGSPYPDYSNKSTFSWVQAILKAQEACKVKLSCFKGIVHPTHFQKQVGWGT